MGFVLIDTCVWINLAATPGLHDLVEGIQRHSTTPHQLVIPASGLAEFERNRPHIATQWVKAMRSHASSMSHVSRMLPDQASTIHAIMSMASAALDKAAADVASAEVAVIKLIQNARRVEHTDQDFRRAGERVLEQRAPARHPKRSATGDSLLWETALHLLNEACVWLCTANLHDFAAEKRADELHPDLATETKGKPHTLHYFNDPSSMIDHLDEVAKLPVKPKPVPRYADYFPPTPSKCWKCGGELRNAGFSPSQYGGWTWKMRCISCGVQTETGDFMDD